MYLRITLLFFAFTIFQFTAAQQIRPKELSFFNIGYGRTIGSFKIPGTKDQKASVGHMTMSYEYFSKHVYFNTDVLTPLLDLCLGAFNQQYWYGHARNGYIFNGGDWPLARLAFGGNVHKNVALFGGGQWGYSRWRIAPGNYVDGKRVYFNTNETSVGGHTFGPGLHALVNIDGFIIRNSLMFDLVTQGFKGKRYTQTLTWDILASYRIPGTKHLGVFANYVVSPGRSDVSFTKLRFGISHGFRE